MGDYVLKELIEENPLFAYQDFQAEHPTTKATRRVRVYNVAGKDKAADESIRRSALQEFRILETLEHPGILSAREFYEHDLGPAILFRREPDEVRLDHYLRQRGQALTLTTRLNLVRQIADAVRYAHGHRVVHRTLSPKSVLVVHPDSDDPQVRLFNWQAGRVLATGSSSGSAASRTNTLHPSQFSEESSLVYLAPESILDPSGRDPMADVFSLGAIAFHIFSGNPPARNATELNQILAEHKGLPLGATLDGATPRMQELIREATAPDLLLRTETVSDFLNALELAEDELTGPPKELLANPLDARPGDLLPHNLKVLKRLGGGSSAVALLVQRGDEVLVLKYARESKDNDRLRQEHQTLTELRHELIVSAKELLSFPDGNAGFLMEYAGEWDRKKPGVIHVVPEDTRTEAVRDTLARELKAVGRLSIEFLARFGEDLLQIVRYLEEKGVAHRDLKPDNIGIKEYAKKLHLKVFDFSLSSAPLDNVRVGTPPYLEPFLQLRPRWDTAAERYAAAVILYEMATGTTPRWGDGQSAPHLTDAEIVIDAELVDAPVREALDEFFRRCFERNPKDRFDNAEEMLASWHDLFQRATGSDSRAADPDARRKALDNLRPDALISQLGLTTRAQNTLDRLGIVTARDRWRRSVPALTAIRNELAEFLKAEGGVVQIDELARFLIASHGSDAPEILALRRSAAVVRAALEAEKPSATNRFEERRHGDLFLIARSEEPHGAQALDYAEKIAEAGTRLAATDPLPSPARVLESLRSVACPIPQLRDDALVRLAAASDEVAISPRLELYPRNLDPLRALKLAQAGLAGIAKITTDELRSRVRDRYPEAQPLPDRPELTDLLIKAGLAFTWDEPQSAWLAPPPPEFASSTSLHRFATVVPDPIQDSQPQNLWIAPMERSPEIDIAFDFERRLQAAYRVPSYLVIATEPRVKYLKQVGENISRHFPMAVFDCEREMLAALRREAEMKKIKWEVIARADAAAAGSRDWENLLKLAASAARRVEEQLKARESSTLVIYPGLLGRYGQLSVLERLADSLGPHGLWLLTGSDCQSASPMADGHAIPARSTQWAWVPEKWLDNKFRTVTV